MATITIPRGELRREIEDLKYTRSTLNTILDRARSRLKVNLSYSLAAPPVDTPQLYAARQERRQFGATFRGFLTKLVADAKAAEHLIVRRTPTPANFTEDVSRTMRSIRQKLSPRSQLDEQCPCCGHATASYGNFGLRAEQRRLYGACEVCMEGGAIYAADRWWKTHAEMVEALAPATIWLLTGKSLTQEQVPSRELYSYQTVKTDEGMPITKDDMPVHYKPGTLKLNYHSGHDIGAYADAQKGVGIELEVNAGVHKTAAMENIIGRILLSTKHAVKVERDGSITGFEVISGYGPPAMLREKIAPIFANDLLKGFRTSQGTGAHVHVTNPWFVRDEGSDEDRPHATHDSNELAQMKLEQGLTPDMRKIYERLAGREYNRFAVSNVGRSHYNCIANRGRTVEFRLFKMQLSLAKLMRNSQFAWSMIGSLSEDVTEARSWLDWIADQPREQTLELRAWLAAEGHKVPHVRAEYKKAYAALGVSSITV